MTGAASPPLRVLVLDSESYVGRRVVRALAGVSWASALVMPRSRVDALLHDPATLVRVLTEADAAINCTGEGAAQIVATARGLFAAAHKVPGKRIVHVGSMTVYGAATGRIDESMPVHASPGAYAAAQFAADALARKCPTAVVLRLGAEYGPGHPLAETLAQLLIAGRIGALGSAGEGHCNAVAIDDVAHAAVAALRVPDAGGRVYNLASTERLSWNDFLVLQAGALGVPLRTVSPARWQAERASAPLRKLIQLAGRPFGARPPSLVSPSLARMLSGQLLLDGQRAVAELGLQYTAHAEALAELAATRHHP